MKTAVVVVALASVRFVACGSGSSTSDGGTGGTSAGSSGTAEERA